MIFVFIVGGVKFVIFFFKWLDMYGYNVELLDNMVLVYEFIMRIIIK